ncbi:YraN family protein [Candidatus Thiodictyon syntrophicum]|uniref:UPF0102 protein THSYN_01490 n=1 Tax=Candidatus Thiodictyon syntrophicum TaxID=1166950 RepID=A0A2K8U2E7_9GAMM|nr:YraN family protein [Candidatus Thiodictyon syntrophicum]AUB79758.1 YraN family protein [Candidatus Thiodictyon syntrophicum]
MKDPGRPGAPSPTAVGADKERLAADWLRDQGLRLIKRNHRCRFGEIDLIMQEGENLVFVEVRYRAGTRFGGAELSVDYHKQRRLCAAAGHYLQAHPSPLACRFDVVAIGAQDRIQWFRNAFDAAF